MGVSLLLDFRSKEGKFDKRRRASRSLKAALEAGLAFPLLPFTLPVLN
jgi:hypothetical protein